MCKTCKTDCFHAGKHNPHMGNYRNKCISHSDKKPRSGGQTIDPDEVDISNIIWTFNA